MSDESTRLWYCTRLGDDAEQRAFIGIQNLLRIEIDDDRGERYRVLADWEISSGSRRVHAR